MWLLRLQDIHSYLYEPAFQADSGFACQCVLQRKSNHNPTQSIFLNPSPPSRLGTELEETGRHPSSGVASMQNICFVCPKIITIWPVSWISNAPVMLGLTLLTSAFEYKARFAFLNRSKLTFFCIQTRGNHRSTASPAVNPVNLSNGHWSRMAAFSVILGERFSIVELTMA